MKPIDLQVNILKSIDMIHEKGRENFQASQMLHRGEDIKEERNNKDFQIDENFEKEAIDSKFPDKVKEREGRRESPDHEKKNTNSDESDDLKDDEDDFQNPIKGHNLDLTG